MVQSSLSRIPGVQVSHNPQGTQTESFQFTANDPTKARMLTQVLRPHSEAGDVHVVCHGMNIMAPHISSGQVVNFLNHLFGVSVSVGAGHVLQVANANPDTARLMQAMVRTPSVDEDGKGPRVRRSDLGSSSANESQPVVGQQVARRPLRDTPSRYRPGRPRPAKWPH